MCHKCVEWVDNNNVNQPPSSDLPDGVTQHHTGLAVDGVLSPGSTLDSSGNVYIPDRIQTQPYDRLCQHVSKALADRVLILFLDMNDHERSMWLLTHEIAYAAAYEASPSPSIDPGLLRL